MPGEAPLLLGGTAIKPVERHGWDAIKHFFYDSEHGTCMGRTPKSWGLIILFYIIYYAVLAAFWALMMYIFMLTITEERPKWEGAGSLIGTSPGVGLRPSQPEESIDSSMIIFNQNKEKRTRNVPGWGTWTNSIRRFLSYYDGRGMVCNPDTKVRGDDTCLFDLSSLGPCAKSNYGFDKGQPCMFLKLNKLYGVANEAYNDTNDLPDDMPESLKIHIGAQKDKNQVWVDCKGENPADRESMGPIKYFPPSRGFPSQYFPYRNQRNYRSPVVAVQFTKPTLGQLLHIECRAWAKNIDYNRMDRIGMVHFELFVMDNELTEEYNLSFD